MRAIARSSAALVVAGATAAGLSLAIPQPAATADLAATQEAHYSVLERIASWDALQPESHLGAASGDPVEGWVEIRWVGEVPAEVRAIAAEAAASGVEVRFADASVSQAELTQAAADVAAALRTEGAFGIGIDDGALTVEVPTTEAAETAGVDGAELTPEVVEAAEAASTVPVDLVETDAVPLDAAAALEVAGRAPIAAGRTTDTGVVSGALRVTTQFRNGSWPTCTSGYTAVYGHRPLIITAAHCSDYTDGRTVRNLAGTTIGRSDLVAGLNDGARPYDLGAIALPYDARTRPDFYTGETATMLVGGTMTANPPSGYRLCSDGQVTGGAATSPPGAPT